MTISDSEGGSRSPGDDLRFQILGPPGVWAGDRWLRIGGPGQRSLLAALLLRANEVVSRSRLIEAIWGETPPRTAVAKLHAHVSALRRLLGTVLDRTNPRQLLATRAPGYVMIVGPEQLDLSRFEQVAQQGHRLLRAEPAQAAAKLRSALSMWRGRALDGIDLGGELGLELMRLEERRFAVLEERIDADLRLGRHHELIGELNELTHVHPLRERLHEQLMLALYRAGRRAEALDAFRQARRQMVQELGLDPGRDLQQLHRAILRADPELDLSAPPAVLERTRPEPFPIRGLPPAIDDLTGRDLELARLSDVLRGPASQSPAMAVAIVSGRAGVGKTVLAVRAAHELRSRFPDGQLYLNLQEAGQAVSPRRLLESLLRTLGIDHGAVPESLVECTQLFRARIGDRRVLVVLDDAATEAQVRQLMPGSPSCAALVTSRCRLEGIEGAHRFDVGLLTQDHAVALLARVVGRERTGSEPAAAATVAERCGRLPLALRVAGAKLAARPHWSLAQMAERLADERRRLDELTVGDLDVRASLILSYRTLTAQERRAFRLAGRLETPDFAGWTMAALLDVDVATAQDLLDRLVDAWLLDASRAGAGRARYSFHSLLRALARERAQEEEPAEALEAADRRMIAAYVALAGRAETGVPGMRGLRHGRSARRQSGHCSPVRGVALGDPLEWYAAELPGITAAVARACELGLDELACDLAASASAYSSLRGQHDEWRRTQGPAARAAGPARNTMGEAYAHVWLGHSHLDSGDALGAEEHFERSRALFAGLQDLRGEAYSLHGLGAALHGRGRLGDALRLLDRCVRLFEALGDSQGQARAQFNLGACQLDRGAGDETIGLLQRSIELFDSVQDPLGKAYAMRCLGNAHRRAGRLVPGLACLRGSLDLFGELDDHKGRAITVLSIGTTYREMGHMEAAAACLQSSLGAFTELNCRFRVGSALYELGKLHQEQGRAGEALPCCQRSLAVFTELGVRVWEARALLAIRELGAPATGNGVMSLNQASGVARGPVSRWTPS